MVGGACHPDVMKLADLQTRADPDNFSNGEWPDGPPPSHWPDRAPAVLLRRVLVTARRRGREHEREEFELLRPIRYAARLGDRQVEVTVPQPDGRFTTDLTSVPTWFTWLVPKSGAHLPAALVHDGLIPERDGPRTYTTSDGLPVDRIDADRVLRDAMRDTHVGMIRRWLVWAAVTTASLVVGPRAVWPWWCRVYYLVVVAVTFGGILYLGTAATVDLVDGSTGWLPGPWMGALPWMDEGPWWREAGQGLAGAIVVPLGTAVFWGRYVRAGAIGGIALATLFHATLVVGVVALGYQAAELVANRPRLAPVALVLVLVAAAVVFGRALT